MTEPPSSAEVLRRLDEITRQLADLVQQLRSDYVRKDVYAAESSALRGRVRDLEAEQDAREKNAGETRRQLFFVVLAAFLPSLGTLIVVLSRLSGSN